MCVNLRCGKRFPWGRTVAQRVVGIIMNGVTGRMGMNQHLIRSILALREQGGLAIGNGDVIWPEPLLVGRSEAKLAALAGTHGLERWSTDLGAAVADPAYEIYFDAPLTSPRPPPAHARAPPPPSRPRSRPGNTSTARSLSRPMCRPRCRWPGRRAMRASRS